MTCKIGNIAFNDSKKEIGSITEEAFKNNIKPITIDEISICCAEYDEIESMIKKATSVYNKKLATQNNSIQDEKITEVIDLYRQLYPYSTYLLCKTANGEIIGSLCNSIKKGPVSFQIEQDYKKTLTPESAENSKINIFYGSVTFIDKDYIENSSLKKDLVITLWSQMLKMTAEMITNSGEGVYLGHIEKSAYSVIKKVLGMPWEQIGDETSWLNSTMVPSMISTDRLKKWLNKK